ncbi:MAG TPA: ABC transporter substrate-binding protein [Candidatus Saccharimonadia bacterium]|nr:ABC transporter substrate-binding protein [Candidatus Saccharimonadia bacterium]
MWLSTLSIIASLVLAFLLAPRAAQAQPLGKMPRIGYLTLRALAAEDEAFKHGLRDLGWIEGQNIAIEYRSAAGQVERLPALAAELVRLQVDCIVTRSTAVVQAAKDATPSIPIVMVLAADPIETGLVASLARPGGNITGMSSSSPELAGKRLEQLRDVLPTLSRVAFLAYGGDPAHRLFLQEAQDAAARLGIQVQPVVIGSVEEIERAFAAMRSTRAEALMVQPVFIRVLGQGQRIADLAVTHRLPTSGPCELVEAGGLLCYGADEIPMYRRAAVFVDKILKGAKPGDLPVEQPMTFTLIINLKTAKALDLTVPPVLLFQADKVIK